MMLRKGWFAGLAVAGVLGGCGGDARPPAPSDDAGTIALDHGPVTTPDGGLDVPPTGDGPALDGGSPTDVTPDRPDAGRDVPATPDLVLILDTGPDAGHPLRGFCGLSPADTAALAVRLATCLNMAPQTLVTQMLRPSYWESGLIPARPCSALEDALTNTLGCANFLQESLKLGVEPTSTGTCGSTPPSCGTGPSGRPASVACANGLTISDDCEAETGNGMCVSSATAAACRPQTDQTAACADGSPARCFQNRVQQCVGGAYVNSRDCDPGLTSCDAVAGACVGTGAACADDADRCDGPRIQQCRGGHLHSIDCGSLSPGTTCRTLGTHSFCGTAFDCDPVAAPANGTCAGTHLTLCVGGTTQSIDCVAAGFVGCGAGGCTH